MSSGNYGSRDLPQPYSSRQLAPGTSTLHRRALQLLEQDELVRYTFEALFISNGEIFALQSEYERVGLEAHTNEMALNLYRVLTLHVHSLDGHYRRSLQLRLMNLKHRFRHDVDRGIPAITILDSYIHVRDRLYLGHSYVDYLFDKNGRLLASWTDDAAIAGWACGSPLLPTIYRDGNSNRWTVGSPERTFVGQWLVHSTQRTSSDRKSLFYDVHSIKSTNLARLKSTSLRDSIEQYPDVPTEVVFEGIGREFDVIDGPAPQIFTDSGGAWMKDDDDELRYLKVSEDTLRLEEIRTIQLKQRLINACVREEYCSERAHDIHWYIAMGGHNDVLLRLVPYSGDSSMESLSKSEAYKLVAANSNRGLFAIAGVESGAIVLHGVYLASGILVRDKGDVVAYDVEGPRPIQWFDLFDEAFADGKLVSSSALVESSSVFVTDFYQGHVTQFETTAPKSMINATSSRAIEMTNSS